MPRVLRHRQGALASECLFRVLVADPPWSFGDRLPGGSRGAEKNYPVLSQEEIEAFPLPPMAQDALLFLWRVSSQVEEAYRVCRAWGFVPKTELVWRKLTVTGLEHFGMGRTLRAAHETCLVAQRGASIVKSRSIRSIISAPVGRHSEKPDLFYKTVERLVDGPYVELFSRKARQGWTTYGNELQGCDTRSILKVGA